MANPWMKFFPSDWRADPALRMCSVSARGLWMEMLCIMHEAEPRGSLLINGHPVTERQLASLTGATLREVNTWIAELELSGVFSRDENGTIFSRRMKRDQEKADQDKANGKAGGNPSLKGGVNPPDKAQKLEARGQSPEAETERKKEDQPRPEKYVFESGVIRLNELDYQRWKRAYSNLNLESELMSMTEWAGKQKSWFNAVSSLLAKRDREQNLERERVRAEAAARVNDPRSDLPKGWNKSYDPRL
jgi:hypothetical protein